MPTPTAPSLTDRPVTDRVPMAPSLTDRPATDRMATDRMATDQRVDLRGEQLNSHEIRLVDAALRCVARWGVAKTTLDDVAREARCSRATVYRTFPGGKDALLEAVVQTEIARLRRRLTDAMLSADTLEDRIVAGITEVGRTVTGHAALQFLFAHEPEIVLPRLAFGALDEVLAGATAFLAPFLEPWLGEEDATRSAEWLTRIVISYVCSPAADVDTTHPPSVRRLVQTFVLPALTATITT